MTNEEIEQAQENYNNLLLEKEKLKQAKNRILELEKEPIVQEYIKLFNYVNELPKLDEKIMLQKSFDTIAKQTKNSNRLLVYMGSYNNYGGKDIEYADYIRYRNLETCQGYNIAAKSRLKFEQNKKIIYLSNDIWLSHYSSYEKAFEKLRNKFLRKLLTQPQDEVVQEFINNGQKVKKKIK